MFFWDCLVCILCGSSDFFFVECSFSSCRLCLNKIEIGCNWGEDKCGWVVVESLCNRLKIDRNWWKGWSLSFVFKKKESVNFEFCRFWEMSESFGI